MKAETPINWLKKDNTEYSFRFHSYKNMYDANNDNFAKRWWIGARNGIAWTASEGDINLDIKDIIRRVKREKISFDIFFSLCISHEIIHNIITRDINNDTSGKFDNICYGKNPNFKQWFAGSGMP